MDNRRLNDITKTDVYALPKSGNTLQPLLDLSQSYWQISVRQKPSLWPENMTSSKESFRINECTDWLHTLVYLKGIIIFARTVERHNRNLDRVLHLAQAGTKGSDIQYKRLE